MLSPSGDFGVCFTLSDDGYIGLQSVTFLDFKNAFEHTETILNAFPMGKLHMPTVSSGGSIRYCDKKLGGRRDQPGSCKIPSGPSSGWVVVTSWLRINESPFIMQKKCMVRSTISSYHKRQPFATGIQYSIPRRAGAPVSKGWRSLVIRVT